jgi:hypothetical protein
MRVTYLFHKNWRPEELANVESMRCSRMNSRRRSQSCDDCVDPGINRLQRPLTQCITQGASFDMESTRPSFGGRRFVETTAQKSPALGRARKGGDFSDAMMMKYKPDYKPR